MFVTFLTGNKMPVFTMWVVNTAVDQNMMTDNTVCVLFFKGDDSCEHLLSSGRFLGEKVWQPHGCMMHKYKQR